MTLAEILAAVSRGDMTVNDAEPLVRGCFFENLGHTTLDHDREARTGTAEVIYGEGKTAGQLNDICAHLARRGANALITRVDADTAQALDVLQEGGRYDPLSRLVTVMRTPVAPAATTVAVVSAGTSDHAVAEEAAQTCEFLGSPVLRINDVGVAGLHRLLDRLDELRSARVVIVVAGMEGALPSVVGGLVSQPVIAVPTSVGYGAAFGGIAALLGMLNSCASGVSVVNIDNGFGAGHLANRINRL